jgi:hypothetical protein
MEGAHMLDQAKHYGVKVRIAQRRDLENQLDLAVDAAIREALNSPGRGVLVTRHDHKTFTVELSDEVPQGTITELALP